MKIKGRKIRRLELDVSHVFDKDQKWCDKDHLLFVTMMILNERFVEDEVKANIVSWDHDSGHRVAYSEFMAVYKFWKAYKSCQDKVDEQLLVKGGSGMYELYEDKLNQLEDQMMHRLIKVRGSMWT
jgi:hypothetical protein